MHKPAVWALLALALVSMASCSTIRGLDPALADRYLPSADGQFRCLDGKKSVPYTSLNDDYCDCLDGSDEPGAYGVTLGPPGIPHRRHPRRPPRKCCARGGAAFGGALNWQSPFTVKNPRGAEIGTLYENAEMQ